MMRTMSVVLFIGICVMVESPLRAQGGPPVVAAPATPGVNGSGTPGTVPVWTGSGRTLTNSLIQSDTDVTINAPLNVLGPARASSYATSAAGLSGDGAIFGVSGYANGAIATNDCCITAVIGSAETPDSRWAIGVGGYVQTAHGWGTQGLNLGGGIGVLAESRGGEGHGTALQARTDGGDAGVFLVGTATGNLVHGFVEDLNAGTWDEKFKVDGAGNLTVTGNAFKPGGGSWSTLSDRRAKTAIEPIGNALSQFLKLRGVVFEYSNPSVVGELPGPHLGMVAQDVEPVFPSWVDTGSDGYKRLTFRGFEAVAVEAIRELKTITESTAQDASARIAALEKQNEQLQAQVKSLVELVQSLQKSN